MIRKSGKLLSLLTTSFACSGFCSLFVFTLGVLFYFKSSSLLVTMNILLYHSFSVLCFLLA